MGDAVGVGKRVGVALCDGVGVTDSDEVGLAVAEAVDDAVAEALGEVLVHTPGSGIGNGHDDEVDEAVGDTVEVLLAVGDELSHTPGIGSGSGHVKAGAAAGLGAGLDARAAIRPMPAAPLPSMAPATTKSAARYRATDQPARIGPPAAQAGKELPRLIMLQFLAAVSRVKLR